MIREAKSDGKMKKKELHHIEVEHSENGGHLVRHHFDNAGSMTFHEPETHVFSEDQGEQMLEHLAKHLNVKEAPPEKAAGESAEKSEEEEEA